MNPEFLASKGSRVRTDWSLRTKLPSRASSEPDRVDDVAGPHPHQLDFTTVDVDAFYDDDAGPSGVDEEPNGNAEPWSPRSHPFLQGQGLLPGRNQDGSQATDRPQEDNRGQLSEEGQRVESEAIEKQASESVMNPSRTDNSAVRSWLQNGSTSTRRATNPAPTIRVAEDPTSPPPLLPPSTLTDAASLQRRPKKRNWSGSGRCVRGRRRREDSEPGPLIEHRFKSISGPTVTVRSSDEFLRDRHPHPMSSDSILHRAGIDVLGAGPASGSSIYVTPNEGQSPVKDQGVVPPPPAQSLPGHQSAGIFLREQIISFFQPSDNKLAMKLFGNKKALMVEKQRQKNVARWIIHPCSNFRLYWDLFMLTLVMANMVILPVAISFFNDDLSTQWIVFNSVCDTVFLMDLLVNFRTGIIMDSYADAIILDPLEIAKHYLKTWFILDFISSVPLDYIIVTISPDSNATQLLNAGRALRIFRLVKLLSLLRLLRLSRLVRYINQWQELLTVAGRFMRVFNLVFVILLLGHWNGCLQWLVPMLQDFPRDSWAAIEGLQSSYWLDQYTWALFKALSHMLCIGFGRYPPQSTTDVWLTIISMLTGATCYAIFVGQSTTVIQSFDTSKRLYREKFKQVEEYMNYRKLPRRLRRNITSYYEHRYRGKMFDETTILTEVNQCLHEEIVNYNCRALVSAVPFFRQTDHNFVSDVVTKLQFEVFLPGDYIIKEGTTGTKMYFIQEGIVAVVNREGEIVTSLSDGSYFGEICLLTNCRRVASVRAETFCSLFSLSVEHFLSVLERYPVMRRAMETVAEQRRNDIETRIQKNTNEDEGPDQNGN